MSYERTGNANSFRISLKRTKKQFRQTQKGFRASHQRFSTFDSFSKQKEFDDAKNTVQKNMMSRVDEYTPRQQIQHKKERQTEKNNTIYHQIQMIIQQQEKQELASSYNTSHKQLQHKYVRSGSSQQKIYKNRQQKDYSFSKNYKQHTHTESEKEKETKLKYSISPFPQQVVPEFVKEQYQSLKRLAGNMQVHFQTGYLRHCGYFYYCIGQKLFLVEGTSHYSCYGQNQDPIVLQVGKQVLYVKQIVIEDKRTLLDISMFGFQQVTLLLVQSWHLQFYSFDFMGHRKVMDLKIRYDLGCQIIQHLDYDSKGNIYYSDEYSKVFKLQLRKQRRFYQRRTRFSIQNYLVYGKPDVSRKKYEKTTFSLWENIKQTVKDISYFMSHKQFKNRELICDRERNLIYTLTKISTNKEGLNKHNQQLMIYINEQPQNTLLNKVGITANTPKLIQRYSQDRLYRIFFTKINPLSLENFEIHSIRVLNRKEHYSANLQILLTNGCRLFIKVDYNSFILIQVIGFPCIQEIFNRKQVGINEKVTQYCSVVSECRSEHSWIVDVQCYRKVNSILIKKINTYIEQVSLLQWPQGSLSQLEIFVNPNHRQYFLINCPKLPCAKYNLKKLVRSVNPCAVQTQIYSEGNHFTYVQKDRLFTITQFRPIDILFEYVNQKSIQNKQKQTIAEYRQLFNPTNEQYDKQLQAFNKQQLLCMLTQIYCDIDGAYFQKTSHIKHKHKDNDGVLIRNKHCDIQNQDIMRRIKVLYKYLMHCQPLYSQIQGSTLYLGRILLGIWNTKINIIQISQMTYINEVLKKIQQLTMQVQECEQLRNLIDKILQLNRLIANIDTLPKITYSEALNKPYNYFQEYIFNTIQIMFKPQKISDWRYLFPKYISKNLFKIVKIYEEVSLIQEKHKILQIVKQHLTHIPQYFINYLTYQRNIKEATILLRKNRTSSEMLLENVEGKSKLQLVYQAIRLIESSKTDIDKKIYLVHHAMKNWQSMDNNEKPFGLGLKLAQYKNGLKIQKLIMREYGVNNKNYKQLLNWQRIGIVKLRQLVRELGISYIQMIFYSYFGAQKDKYIKDSIKSICKGRNTFTFTQKQTQTQIQMIRKQLQRIFTQIPSKQQNKLQIIPIMQALDQHTLYWIQQNNMEISQEIQQGKISKPLQELLWVSKFIIQWGWNQVQINDYYIKQTQSKLKQDIRLVQPNQFLYYWLNGYVLVKDYFERGRRPFRHCSQNLIQKIQNKAVSNLISNMRRLLTQVCY